MDVWQMSLTLGDDTNLHAILEWHNVLQFQSMPTLNLQCTFYDGFCKIHLTDDAGLSIEEDLYSRSQQAFKDVVHEHFFYLVEKYPHLFTMNREAMERVLYKMDLTINDRMVVLHHQQQLVLFRARKDFSHLHFVEENLNFCMEEYSSTVPMQAADLAHYLTFFQKKVRTNYAHVYDKYQAMIYGYYERFLQQAL